MSGKGRGKESSGWELTTGDVNYRLLGASDESGGERKERVTPSSVHPGTHSGEDHVREEKGSLEMRWLSQSIVSLRLLIISVNLTGCTDV